MFDSIGRDFWGRLFGFKFQDEKRVVVVVGELTLIFKAGELL